ncbi:MAG: Hpt domain-containing protein [Alphaproteobacteria bacterium]|nr:Hpt domain-containing protein [Alphaproteobacteria bacterium]
MVTSLLRFRQGYFDECEQLLTGLRRDVLSLDDGDVPARSEALIRASRAAHSIKGGAGAFGLAGLETAASTLEAALDRLIERGELDDGAIAALRDGCEVLEAAFVAAREGIDLPAEHGRTERAALDLLTGVPVSPPEPPPLLPEPPPPETPVLESPPPEPPVTVVPPPPSPAATRPSLAEAVRAGCGEKAGCPSSCPPLRNQSAPRPSASGPMARPQVDVFDSPAKLDRTSLWEFFWNALRVLWEQLVAPGVEALKRGDLSRPTAASAKASAKVSAPLSAPAPSANRPAPRRNDDDDGWILDVIESDTARPAPAIKAQPAPAIRRTGT